jgi:methylamine dehydrogenase accessory protein MauD
MIDVIAIALRFGLAAVFAVAAVAKLRDSEGTAEALKGFGVPEKNVPQATYLLPASEGLAVLLLVIPATYVVGAVWALGLLLAFTTAIVVNLARGNRVACRCFGEMSAKPIGARTVARNVGLLAIAAYVLVAAPSTFGYARRWFESMTPEVAKLSAGMGVIVAAVAGMSWLLARLFDQNQSLIKRLEALESVGQPQGLEPGTEAPTFELPTTDGTTLQLGHLLARGKPVILTFTDPHCGPCQSLVPQLAMWQKSLTNVFTVGIVSRGEPEDNSEHATEHGLAEVMIQKHDEVAESYKVAGTPNAVRLSPEGEVESYIARGVEEITALFEQLIAEHAQNMWEQATGEEIPRPYTGLPLDTEAPDMVVHDLDGNQHRLPDLVGDPTMLVFWSPRCSFCHQIADDIRALETRLPDGRNIVFATIGTAEENRFMAFRSPMLFDPDFELGGHFHAQGTPAAVLLEKGKVASGLESGTNGVLALAEQFVGPGPQMVETPTFQPSDN